ncbi:hypothetical protein EON81_03090 [bacterium]|nr:MAG: hypothetical protein EON81_03090 [bacterium]
MSIAMLAGYGFGVPWPNCLFPFDLIFEGVTYVGWRSVDKKEGLSWMPPLAVSENEPSTWWMDTFLEPEQIGVRWALLFRHTYRNRYSRGMLLVEAASMRVVERQRQVWIDRVGSASLPIFDEYQAQRNENTLTVFEYREKYFREHGLPIQESEK